MFTYIFPTSLLNSSKVDEHFGEEALLTENNYVLFDSFNKKLLARNKDISQSKFIYRGWILTSNEYKELESLIKKSGSQLLTSSQQYDNAQFGTNWIKSFEKFTPKTTVLDYSLSVNKIKSELENLHLPLVIKGQSKSLKHDWFNSMFVKNKEDLERVLNNFKDQVTVEEEPFILYREFENWQIGELRTWWFNGKLVQAEGHPDTPDFTVTDNELSKIKFLLSNTIKNFDNKFFVIDLVQNAESNWRIVEVGDGQVCESWNYLI